MDHSAQAQGSGPFQRKVRITNPQGFHLRPMQAFAQLAAQFQSEIRLCRDGREFVDGKSPFSLLLVSAERGAEMTVEAQGLDASAAVDALVDLLANLETRVDAVAPE